MKIRDGFVSNSSSSSFILNRHVVSDEQVKAIVGHIEYSKDKGWLPEKGSGELGYPEEWEIEINEHEILGHTYMNNFDFEMFMRKIGVPEEYIHFQYDG